MNRHDYSDKSFLSIADQKRLRKGSYRDRWDQDEEGFVDEISTPLDLDFSHSYEYCEFLSKYEKYRLNIVDRK